MATGFSFWQQKAEASLQAWQPLLKVSAELFIIKDKLAYLQRNKIKIT